jgi:hypothetical protein
VAQQLRVEQASLEDAFVALTGRHPETEQHASQSRPGQLEYQEE